MIRIRALLAAGVLLAVLPLPASALDFTGIFKSKPQTAEVERQDTLKRMQELQDQLRLLQEHLHALERRKAIEDAPPAVAGENNWQEIDRLHNRPDPAGLYTYLLFAGSEDDATARECLETLLQTIESLPANSGAPALRNRFLVPAAPQQTMVVLARRPYDFKLARAYLERLGFGALPNGPVLVSLGEPLDPLGGNAVPPFLAVALGCQDLWHSRTLAEVWHGYEKPLLPATGHPLADLFWQLVDGTGPARVTSNGGRLLIDLAPGATPAPP